jgi:chromosome segregation ATPase
MVILSLMAVILVFVVHFVLVSRRKLRAIVEESRRQYSLTGTSGRFYDEPLKPKWVEKKKLFPVDVVVPFSFAKWYKTTAPAQGMPSLDKLHDLTCTVQEQQKTIDNLLTRLNKLDTSGSSKSVKMAAASLVLEEETELQKTKQQLSAAQKIAGRVTEVYREFDLMHQKMAELEESASRANELALELDDMQQAYELLKKEAARKQEKLHEMMQENEDLHQQIAHLKEKFADTNTQRQQLQKRVQCLENMNGDLQHINETNQKMKMELRRIAELESMLSLVSEERDLLVKKRLS